MSPMTLNFPQLKESCSTALEWKVGSEDPSGPVMSDDAAAVAWRGMGMAAVVAQWLESDFSIVCHVFGPSGFRTMAPLCYAAKFDPFLSSDCARHIPGKGRDQILPSGNPDGSPLLKLRIKSRARRVARLATKTSYFSAIRALA